MINGRVKGLATSGLLASLVDKMGLTHSTVISIIGFSNSEFKFSALKNIHIISNVIVL